MASRLSSDRRRPPAASPSDHPGAPPDPTGGSRTDLTADLGSGSTGDHPAAPHGDPASGPRGDSRGDLAASPTGGFRGDLAAGPEGGSTGDPTSGFPGGSSGDETVVRQGGSTNGRRGRSTDGPRGRRRRGPAGGSLAERPGGPTGALTGALAVARRGDLPGELPSDLTAARDIVRAARHRRRQKARHRKHLVAGVMAAAALIAAFGLGRQMFFAGDSSATGPVDREQPMLAPPSRPASPPPGAGPAKGDGTFAFATAAGPVLGAGGEIKKFRVAVENGSGQPADAFVEAVDKTFADPRGWTASGQLRLQRVAGEGAADFTIFLATPVTSEAMCAAAGLHTEGYSSCRTTGKVIINLARWLIAIPDYGAPVADYRTYVVNHETGHELGFGHEACPGPGRRAPVMMQQTYGLQGCVPNSWPYVDGQRYAGPKVP
jgi:hypothetical protein